MRLPLFLIIVLSVINVLVDCYVYCAMRSYIRRRIWSRIQGWSAVALAMVFILIICMPKRSGSEASLRYLMWMLYGYLSIYLPKYIFLILDVLSRLPLLWRKPRWRSLSVIGAVIGVLSFGVMWWGALFNRFNIDVVEVTAGIKDLPESFDGFTIVQISDLHVGTYGSDTAFVHNVVDKVNSLNPDIILFTGDIVNRYSCELEPFVPALSRLKARHGVYSILGNHDYGDYADWETPEARQDNMALLYALQARMGWKLLDNATAWIKNGGDSIAIIGVENVGDPPFRTYGNLDAAYRTLDDPVTKILLTHNPSHWVNDIRDRQDKNIALTLSGHTHAMQMEIMGLSPAAWRYDTWGGMYSDKYGKLLYVNIGLGTVGIPARIGATPEITLFTLKSAN